jgi:hypothetical protein
MKKSDKAKRITQVYAKNLSIYKPETQSDIFVCPLLGKGIRYKNIADFSEMISLAHIYPEALGGKKYVVASKVMNNMIGKDFEGHLSAHDKQNDWAVGQTPIKVNLDVEGKHLAADLWLKDGKNWNFVLVDKASDPRAIESMKNGLHNCPEGFNFNMRWVIASERKKAVAYVQSGYLLAFRYFGYEYALYPSSSQLRSLWNEPIFIDQITKRSSFWFNPTQSTNTIDGYSLGVVTNGPARGLMLAVLPCFNKEGQSRGVLLPGFSEEPYSSWDDYINRLDSLDNGSKLTADFIRMPEWEDLMADSYAFMGHRFWGA